MSPWIFLGLAIAFEVAGTTCMKLSEGFSRPIPSILIFVFYGVSFTLFTLSVKHIDISVAYAIWSAVGVAAITAIGFLRFGEDLSPVKLLFIAVIIVGVIGLRLTDGGSVES